MSSLDIELNLVLSWFKRSSTTWTRSEGCVSGAGYIRRVSCYNIDVLFVPERKRASYYRRVLHTKAIDLGRER
jgi:hypothetical protein